MNKLSAIRRFISLDVARGLSDGYVILDGDFGAVCFLVCPAKLARCNEETLLQLAATLQDIVFPGDSSGAEVRFDRLDPGEELSGYSVGEENGKALSTLWLPSWLVDSGMSERIQHVLDGQLQRFDLSESEKTGLKELHRQFHIRKLEEDIR